MYRTIICAVAALFIASQTEAQTPARVLAGRLAVANTDMTQLPQVVAARATHTQPVQVVKDVNGRKLLVAHAAVEPPRWLLFVEIPLDEADALAQ